MLSYTGTRVVTIFYHYETRVVNNMMKEEQSYLLCTVLEEIWKPNIPWNVHVCGCVVMLVLKSELVASKFMIFKAIRAFHLDICFYMLLM